MDSVRQLEDLHRAYRDWAGEPYSISTFRRDNATPGFPALDVLCYRSGDEDQLDPKGEFTFLATAGLSWQPVSDARPPSELVWRITGRRPWDEIQSLSESLASIAVLPLYGAVSFIPGTIIRGASLPVFDKMNSLLVTHWGVYSPEYLPGTQPPILLLWIKALYSNEASMVERIGDREACRVFRKQGIDWDDPGRLSARRERFQDVNYQLDED